MQDVPQVIGLDESGQETLTYDPAAIVTEGGASLDLFGDAGTTSIPASAPPADSVDEPDQPAADATDPAPAPPPATEPAAPDGVPVVQPTIVARYPHDGAAFTQGLEFADGVLIESLGILGESARRRVEPTTGEVTASARLSEDQFGAGLTITDNQIIQLTWQQGVAIVSDLTTLLELARFSYDGEGWGLCQLDDGRLTMSNGSGFLTFRDPATFEVTGELEITRDGTAVTNLNELECVGSSIYANVWLETDILEIDVASGEVVRVIDSSSLVPGDLGPDDVLNGIAYRADTNTFFLTGKRWTVLYEVSFS